MIFFAKIKDKILSINDLRRLDKFIASFEKDCEVEVKIEKKKGLRTNQQNAAIHLYFTQLAEALNEKGFPMNKILKGDVDIMWTPYLIKEVIWKPLQKSMFGEKSTTKLKKLEEIDKIFDVINKVIGERTDGEVSIPFPSIEWLDNEFN